jgi:hypothetical protein
MARIAPILGRLSTGNSLIVGKAKDARPGWAVVVLKFTSD